MPSKVHRNVDLGTKKKEREKEVKSIGPDSYLRFVPVDCGFLLQVTWCEHAFSSALIYHAIKTK